MATNPDPNGGPYKGPYITPSITKAPAPLGPFGSKDPTPAANAPGTLPETFDPHAPATFSQTPAATDFQSMAYMTTPAATVLAPATGGVGDQGAVTPPHSPNSWQIEDDSDGIPRQRDPYRVDGMIGQDFLKNQG